MPQLKKLVLMPHLECNANCLYCEGRTRRHKKAKQGRLLTLDEYYNLVDQSKRIGTKDVVISGGEPTLFPDLIDLIKICKNS